MKQKLLNHIVVQALNTTDADALLNYSKAIAIIASQTLASDVKEIPAPKLPSSAEVLGSPIMDHRAAIHQDIEPKLTQDDPMTNAMFPSTTSKKSMDSKLRAAKLTAKLQGVTFITSQQSLTQLTGTLAPVGYLTPTKAHVAYTFKSLLSDKYKLIKGCHLPSKLIGTSAVIKPHESYAVPAGLL